MENEIDPEALLSGLDGQPEEVRRIFIYAICETMVRAGTLQFVGASSVPGFGTTLLYRNPDTQEVFEIMKPDLSPDDEDEMHHNIDGLLASNA